MILPIVLFCQVLRPHCSVSNLKLWSYFVSENVSTGPTFDQELINETETAAEEGQQKLEDKYNSHRYGSLLYRQR